LDDTTRQADDGAAAALRGLRILETGSGVALRYLGRMLAALGAEVTQVGPVGDDARLGFAGEAGLAYGDWLDDKKHRGAPEGPAVDAIICGQTPSEIAEGARLQSLMGGVLLALDWFDRTGPYATWRATDEIILALNGSAFGFGLPEGPPMLPQGHAPQITAAVVALNGLFAALLTPPMRRPSRIDVNVLEASLCYAETAAVTAASTGAPSQRLGVNRFTPTYPASPYRASDGWVGVTCLTPAQWSALCALIDRRDLLEDARFATASQRLAIASQVDAALAPAIARRSQAEWIALGIAHRIPIAPMNRPGDLPDLPHWRKRRAFAPIGQSELQGPALPYAMRFEGPPTAPPKGGEEGPLCGLRVVDFSMGWSGPLCARTLADLGADVVKIESEARPDWWRGWEAGSVDVATRETQLNFIDVNRNKRGVDLDLTTSEGRDRALALVAGADVVVENYAAGVLDKLGLGKDVQKHRRPGIITLTMPAFGAQGPWAGLRAYGSTVEQASGLPFVNGEAAWAPAQQHVAKGDAIAGLYAASAVLAALLGRACLGGADIDLAQVACLFQLGADAIIAEQVNGVPVPRTGHDRERLALCCVAQGAGPEDWLVVVADDEVTQARLEAILGGPAADRLASWSATRLPESAARTLQSAGVPAAPVNPPHGLTRDPQLQAVGYFQTMERAYVGRHLVGASPFRFDGRRPRLRRPAPLLGEHTAEVLAELSTEGR
jgi:crotonobetainyl-CoA:carnitine CoA-transferase CaiB-like acyl-CoA transferase